MTQKANTELCKTWQTNSGKQMEKCRIIAIQQNEHNFCEKPNLRRRMRNFQWDKRKGLETKSTALLRKQVCYIQHETYYKKQNNCCLFLGGFILCCLLPGGIYLI